MFSLIFNYFFTSVSMCVGVDACVRVCECVFAFVLEENTGKRICMYACMDSCIFALWDHFVFFFGAAGS